MPAEKLNKQYAEIKPLNLSAIADKTPTSILPEIFSIDSEFPMKVSAYYFSLIDFDNILCDPVFKQIFPSIHEQDENNFHNEDPLAEDSQMPVKNLIHRYRDRAVLLVTNKCAAHCRFCLRKRKWKQGTSQNCISDENLEQVCKYLKQHSEVTEILISGGDPLMLSTDALHRILLRISQIPSIEIMRLGTRMPVVYPMRIDTELVEMLSNFPGLWLATHFNHPVELTDEALNACSQFIQKGIPVVNQTVLLKDVNDKVEILADLFKNLAKNKIKPLYLFHLDQVKGNAHFETGINAGIEIMRQLRNQISSIATPIYAIDLPEGGGKVPLLPNYLNKQGYEAIDGRRIEFDIPADILATTIF